MRIFDDKLDSEYVESIDRLEEFESKIAVKKKKIETIHLAYYDDSKYQSKTLYISDDDRESKLTEVIDAIQGMYL